VAVVGEEGPTDRVGLVMMLRRRGAQAGLPGLYRHQLRHTFAHEWLAQGGNETDLKGPGCRVDGGSGGGCLKRSNMDDRTSSTRLSEVGGDRVTADLVRVAPSSPATAHAAAARQACTSPRWATVRRFAPVSTRRGATGCARRLIRGRSVPRATESRPAAPGLPACRSGSSRWPPAGRAGCGPDGSRRCGRPRCPR